MPRVFLSYGQKRYELVLTLEAVQGLGSLREARDMYKDLDRPCLESLDVLTAFCVHADECLYISFSSRERDICQRGTEGDGAMPSGQEL
jgi:hypothetical protein